MKLFYLLILAAILSVNNLACKKADHAPTSYDSESIRNLKFIIESASMDPKLDLNGDGIASCNLLEELKGEIMESDLRLEITNFYGADLLFWPWPLVVVTTDKKVYVEQLPNTYDTSMVVKHSINSRTFQYAFDPEKQIVIPTKEIAERSLSYQRPDYFALDRVSGKVSFSLRQQFMTSQGPKTCVVWGTYKQVDAFPNY